MDFGQDHWIGLVCEYAAVRQGDSLYQIFHDLVSYEVAVASCASKGAKLVTITSADIHETLMESFAGAPFWIAFNDRLSEGDWGWESGEAVDYSNWRLGHPRVEDEGIDCARIENNQWGSRFCFGTNPYVCEFALP